jgi:hypothetical protein
MIGDDEVLGMVVMTIIYKQHPLQVYIILLWGGNSAQWVISAREGA